MRRHLLAVIVAMAIVVGGTAMGRLDAQEADALASADLTADQALLTEDELDALVAPVALYPDSLLTQVFVASTYPIDLVKADRFVAANSELSDKDRATAAEAEDWDPSIQVLTAGFPTVVQRMATEIDWTEDLGDAMLAQTDDLLDAVQRQRARAVALGNLGSNEAQVVEEQDENITIAPADPDVVYVPTYDATTAFAQPYTTAPVIGASTADLVTTGAIAFGGAMLIDSIFDDDDDDWDDYWRPGPPRIDWDDGDFHPRPDINIEGDVNIDRDRFDAGAVRIGDGDRLKDAGTWKPSAQRQREAREKLAERKRTGAIGGGATAAATRDKLKAGTGGDAGARAKLAAASADHKVGAAPKKASDSAFRAKAGDAGKAKQAVKRGNVSLKKDKVASAAQSRPKAVTKAKQVKIPARKAAPKTTAFKKPSGSSHGANAAKARGGKSAGAGRKR